MIDYFGLTYNYFSSICSITYYFLSTMTHINNDTLSTEKSDETTSTTSNTSIHSNEQLTIQNIYANDIMKYVLYYLCISYLFNVLFYLYNEINWVFKISGKMFMFIIHLVFNFQMFQWIFENLKNITNTFKKIDFRSYKTKINNLKKKK